MATKKKAETEAAPEAPEPEQVARVDVRGLVASILVEQNRLERRERALMSLLRELIPQVDDATAKRIKTTIGSRKKEADDV